MLSVWFVIPAKAENQGRRQRISVVRRATMLDFRLRGNDDLKVTEDCANQEFSFPVQRNGDLKFIADRHESGRANPQTIFFAKRNK